MLDLISLCCCSYCRRWLRTGDAQWALRNHLFLMSLLLENICYLFLCRLSLPLSLEKGFIPCFWIAVGTHVRREGKEGGEEVRTVLILAYFSPEVCWRQLTRNPLILILLLVKESLRDMGCASSIFVCRARACVLLCSTMPLVNSTLLADAPLPAHILANRL